jgi:hypothetical protein
LNISGRIAAVALESDYYMDMEDLVDGASSSCLMQMSMSSFLFGEISSLVLLGPELILDDLDDEAPSPKMMLDQILLDTLWDVFAVDRTARWMVLQQVMTRSYSRDPVVGQMPRCSN